MHVDSMINSQHNFNLTNFNKMYDLYLSGSTGIGCLLYLKLLLSLSTVVLNSRD